MSKDFQLVKSDRFGNVQCDFYSDGKGEFYMSREQIGAALEYGTPRKAISDIHNRHKGRLDKYSVVLKLRTTDGKLYDTTVYPRKGIMEICRWSQQPKADSFMDWTWNIMDALITGKAKVLTMTEYQKLMVQTRRENIGIRKARELERLSKKYEGQSFAQVLDSYATKELTGEHLIPLPATKKSYSAGEIGDMFGITATAVGILANKNGLKVEKKTGEYRNDKSRSSNKEVPNFYYYDCVLPEFERLAAQWKSDRANKPSRKAKSSGRAA